MVITPSVRQAKALSPASKNNKQEILGRTEPMVPVAREYILRGGYAERVGFYPPLAHFSLASELILGNCSDSVALQWPVIKCCREVVRIYNILALKYS